MAKTFDAAQFGQDYVDNSLKSLASVSKGLQSITSEAVEYSKKSYEAGAAALEKLANAKSLESAFEIQNTYARSAYESLVAQAAKVSELYADLAKDAVQPFEAAFAKTR